MNTPEKGCLDSAYFIIRITVRIQESLLLIIQPKNQNLKTILVITSHRLD